MNMYANIALSGLLICSAAASHAGVLGDNVTPYVRLGYSQHSNVYREKTDETEVDTTDAVLGIRGDVELGRQELIFDVSKADRAFDDESHLDYSPFNADLTLNWRIGGKFNGVLMASYDEVLSDYSQTLPLNTNQDVETRRREELEINYTPSSRIKMLTALRRVSLEHSEEVRENIEERQNEVEIDLLFRSVAGTYLGVNASLVQGEYPNRSYVPGSLIDDGYEQKRFGVAFDWEPSAETQLKVRGGRAEREFDNVSTRDYDAPFWSADLRWAMTPQVDLSVLLLRDIASIDNVVTSVARRDSLSVRLDWRMSPKLTMILDALVGEDDFQSLADEESPNDELFVGRAKVEYAMSRLLVMTFGVEYGDRSSSFDRRDFDYTFLSASMEFRL